jgi:DNA repair protein RadC
MKLSKSAEDAVIAQALEILGKRVRKPGKVLSAPDIVVKYLKLKLARLEHEVFGILFLDIKNKLIADKVMFTGSHTHTAVYPREVIKEALRLNAAFVILYHNHPSGDVTPSPGDLLLTKGLTSGLSTVDIKVVDHIIVAGTSTFSFQQGGLI